MSESKLDLSLTNMEVSKDIQLCILDKIIKTKTCGGERDSQVRRTKICESNNIL